MNDTHTPKKLLRHLTERTNSSIMQREQVVTVLQQQMMAAIPAATGREWQGLNRKTLHVKSEMNDDSSAVCLWQPNGLCGYWYNFCFPHHRLKCKLCSKQLTALTSVGEDRAWKLSRVCLCGPLEQPETQASDGVAWRCHIPSVQRGPADTLRLHTESIKAENKHNGQLQLSWRHLNRCEEILRASFRWKMWATAKLCRHWTIYAAWKYMPSVQSRNGNVCTICWEVFSYLAVCAAHGKVKGKLLCKILVKATV